MTHRREALLEFTIVGEYARLAAIDPETGLEVVVMGPAHASRLELEHVALAKLDRALARRREQLDHPPPDPPRPVGRGRIV